MYRREKSMDKEYLIHEVDKVKQIVDTGILVVDGIELDIKSKLNQFESKEYRQKDIEEIELLYLLRPYSPCKYACNDNFGLNSRSNPM